MSEAAMPWVIVGQGLAGTCLAWQLWRRGVPFRIIDREQGGSSRIAAGLINPIIGKNFTLSWRFAEFLNSALPFYHQVEQELGMQVWHPLPIERVLFHAQEVAKLSRQLLHSATREWIEFADLVTHPADLPQVARVQGGGRLDTAAFLDGSRQFFADHGRYARQELPFDSQNEQTVWCEGSAGLLAGRLKKHECAKGEILTVRAKDWRESVIRVGGGGWIVPVGNQLFKVGATYDWANLDGLRTEAGKARLIEFAQRLGGNSFDVLEHHVGIRPIIWRSQPMIGRLPDHAGWLFNGLGSKGSLYAPGVSEQLANAIVNGAPIDSSLDLQQLNDDGTRLES